MPSPISARAARRLVTAVITQHCPTIQTPLWFVPQCAPVDMTTTTLTVATSLLSCVLPYLKEMCCRLLPSSLLLQPHCPLVFRLCFSVNPILPCWSVLRVPHAFSSCCRLSARVNLFTGGRRCHPRFRGNVWTRLLMTGCSCSPG